MLGPTNYQPTRRRAFQPDLLVAERRSIGDGPITQPLLLAVEVLSPSTRSVDLLLESGLYAESGVATYLVVDPLVPSVQAWSLIGGGHVEAGSATGSDTLALDTPFPLTLTPQDLLDL